MIISDGYEWLLVIIIIIIVILKKLAVTVYMSSRRLIVVTLWTQNRSLYEIIIDPPETSSGYT